MRNIIARFVSFFVFIRSYTDPVVDMAFSPANKFLSMFTRQQVDLLWMSISLGLMLIEIDRVTRRYVEKDYYGVAFSVLMLLYWSYQSGKVFNSFGHKPSDEVSFGKETNKAEDKEVDEYLNSKNLK